MRKKLQEYALIAKIIGGIAIVLSLIFVGMQIRQNSEISQVNAYQELVSQIAVMNTLRIQDAEFADLFWRFDHGQQPQDDQERARLEAFGFRRLCAGSRSLVRFLHGHWQLLLI